MRNAIGNPKSTVLALILISLVVAATLYTQLAPSLSSGTNHVDRSKEVSKGPHCLRVNQLAKYVRRTLPLKHNALVTFRKFHNFTVYRLPSFFSQPTQTDNFDYEFCNISSSRVYSYATFLATFLRVISCLPSRELTCKANSH